MLPKSHFTSYYSHSPAIWAMVKVTVIQNIWLWFRRRVLSRHVQKKWLRATVTLVAMLVFIVNPSTSRTIGQADIFSASLAVALPPFLPISAHIYMMVVLLFWILFSWAWTCTATAVAFAARNKTLLMQQNQAALASFVPGIPFAAQEELLVAAGHFLDPRSSAVFGAFFFLGSFIFALGLGHRPNLSFALFFALTLMVALFSVNPLLPYASYWSAHSFVVAATFYAAISIATLALIFPESFNHSWLCRVREEVLLPVIRFMEHDNVNPTTILDEESISHLDSIINTYEMEKDLFDLEFSVHRLSPLDIVALYKHVKQLVARVKNIEVCHNRVEKFTPKPNEAEKQANVSHALSVFKHILWETSVERAALSQKSECMNSSHSLRMACQAALMDIEGWVRECTMDSWSDVFSPVDKKKADSRRLRLEISRSNLLNAQAKFRKDDLPGIVEGLKRGLGSLSEIQDLGSHIPLTDRESAIVLTYMDNIDVCSTELFAFLSFLINIEEGEPKPVPRLPRILRTFFSKFSKSNPKEEPARSITPSTPLHEEEKDLETPIKTTPTTSTYLVSSGRPTATPSPSQACTNTRKQRSRRILRWLSAPETIYALRVGILSVALFTLGVCKTTTSVYTSYTGLIATLLAQSYVAIYAGDQIFFFVIRFSGTVLGLLFTLAGWYIGAGRGTGNVYSFIVITTILALPPLLVSVSSWKLSHMLFAVLFSTTVVSTTSLIWIETRSSASSSLVFRNIWDRALMDIIGFAASAVVMMLPVPITARRGFHDRLSESLMDLEKYLQSRWLEDSEEEKYSPASSRCNARPSISYEERERVLRSIAEKQARMKHFLTSMKFDPRIGQVIHSSHSYSSERPLSNRFPRGLPSATYREIYDAQARLVSSTMHYIEGLERLDPALRRALACQMPCLSQDTLDEVQRRIASLARGRSSAGGLGQCLPPTLRAEVNITLDEIPKPSLDSKGGELNLDALHINFLDNNISDNAQVLILSSVIVNLAAMVDAIDDLGSLLRSVE
ncbi:hypothetical protein BDZ97DRAFT_2083222 [Flammula alnicola]|nr:hypothetical protein BDZ97DRAFT_2083222 [Flammula alnicola]